MDPLRMLTAEHGFFTRPDALGCGLADRDLTQLVRGRALVRFRRGSYAFTDEWFALDDVGRHLVRARAVLRSLGPSVALSHVSGVVRHGIDSWGLPLDRVHVTRLDGAAGRIEGDVVHHEGTALGEDVLEVGGDRVLRADRCAIEAASRSSNEVALCLFDAGARTGLFDEETLFARFQAMEHWPFVRHLHVPVRMADGRSGSVGESRGRWLFHTLHLPCPELQHEVRDHRGELIGIADWWWEEHNLLGEFDGAVKYGRLLKPGQEPGDVVFAEKRREDRMREARDGARILRLVWSDYEEPAAVRGRMLRLMRRTG